MQNKYFEISSFGVHKYDLLITSLDLSKPINISNDEVDQVFVTKLRNWSYEKLVLDDVPLFLEYHFKKFKGDPIDFLNHIIDILDHFKDQLSLYHVITRKINEWLIEKENELPKRKKRKSFKTVFYDESKAEVLIEILKTHEVIDSKNTWIGLEEVDTTINILIDVLKDKGCIMYSNRTDMSSIFCEKFNLELNPTSKRSTPKGRTYKGKLQMDYKSEFKRMLSSFKC